MTNKRRYTEEEVLEVLQQIDDDRRAAELRMRKIADHITKISGFEARVADTDWPGERSMHPYFYIYWNMCQYDSETPWQTMMLNGPTKCVPARPGINIHTRGFMFSGNVPDVGDVEDIFVCVQNYDSHASGW